ncbi:MAG: NADH-quinone oxidoreductase subunit NuoH [Anaerolineaceae bacterium]
MSFWRDPINFIIQWVKTVLEGWGAGPDGVVFWMNLLGAVLVPLLAMFFCLFLIWYERKVLGRVQDRLGPNRLGPWGIIQPIADMLKIFTKEYITPQGADKVIYNLAPILSVAAVLLIWAVVPFQRGVYGADLNVGVLYIMAVGSIGALAVLMAGWSSNNKYAVLGAIRSVAQLISYEVPMTLSLLVPVMLSHSMSMNDIVASQDVWFVVTVPFAAFIFFVSTIAEVGRSPFDLLEAESELVAGYNVEYSGLKFGMFYVAEFLHSFTVAMLFSVIFLGGWRGPGAESVPILGFVYLFIKTMAVYFLSVLIRGSLPRFRIDQMINLNWKVFVPQTLAVVIFTAVVDKLMVGAPMGWRVVTLLAVNVVIGMIMIVMLGKFAHGERERQLRSVKRTDSSPA